MGVNLRPFQVRWELQEFIRLVRSRSARSILEIGTANGGTLFALSQVCASDAIVISIDLPGGPYGGGYPRWREPLYRSFARPGQRIELLLGDSHSEAMVTRVERVLDGRALDVVLIDGDHAYDGVRRDFENYLPLLSPHGLIAFHDIVPESSRGVTAELDICPGDVSEFWSAIRNEHTSREIVEDWEQGGFGIGVLQFTPRP
jgi:predicted O-methyltransferase YrrM